MADGRFKKGNKPWNKGIGEIKKCLICYKSFYVKKSHANRRKYCSRKCSSMKNITSEHRLNLRLSHLGKMVGEDNPYWRGGISIFQIKVRGSWKYREWRDFVYQRDNYKCVKCNSSIRINAHHLKSFALLLKENNIKDINEATDCEMLWDINNGVTLCKECHYEIHRLNK